MESRALVRFPAYRLASPLGGGEEEPDAALALWIAVMNDVGKGEVSRVDVNAGLLVRFADRALGD